MITTANLQHFLEVSGCPLSVDMANKKLIYPEAVRGREHNTSFDAPENFVVFECVHRLIEKGYRPEDIELEKGWTLGRTQKGGRADICVYERGTDEVLMIIECKTWGKEYDNALKDTKNYGAQLFSYWQQEGAAKWLVLYTSDLQGDSVVYKSPTVNCSDDNNLILQSEHDDSIKLYRDADSADKKFIVWRDTYNLELHDNIIFSPDTVAYDIGIKPLRKRDLEPFSEDNKDSITNKFEEILRHNNISDKENAFNRLIALFICKLVDEISKDEAGEVDFQYRPRTDSYEMLQDRLQRLYTEGMKEFMREDITYIDADYPEKLFANYRGGTRSRVIDDLKAAFRKLKYFTNNDFAFKDVHNEELFYQNGKVLVEVVQLFQKFKIVHTSRHQVLGDLFEQLLDKGFRQNEGQFFTPTPITRFIWDCLPLRRFTTWPKVIDYACGAGHFLTEAIEAVNHFIPSENNSWTRDYIFGIEKDYRLARVSKVSLFMNGAGDGNIIFGDGLENTDKIKPGTFDILTANPPYSVASFKQHLNIKQNTFTLLDTLTPSSSEIEVLFVERIAQLLASGGIAAVILPSSILSNDSSSYTGAREQILRNFRLRALIQLGSKTFGATGTNTVIMFLERYSVPPERFALVQDSVDAILEGRNLSGWEDEDILAGYLELQGISPEEWREFVNKPEPESLPEYFRNYLAVFSARKDTQKLKDFRRKFYGYARKVEAEKLLYYGLTYTQRTVVILAPSDNAGQKEFLGYDWSSRKGDEGIKIAVRGGKLYDDADREKEGTLAHVVRQSFGDGEIVLTEDNARFARVVRTCEMLDFSRVTFNAAMRIREKKGIDLDSKYPAVKLSSVCMMNIPKSEARDYPDDTPATFIDMSSVSTDGKVIARTDRPIKELWTGSYAFFREGDVICAKMMTSAESLKCAVADGLTNGIGFGSSEFYTFRCGEKIMTRYLCEFLNLPTVREAAWASVTGTGRLRVPSRFYETLTIPLPSMEIQQQIVKDCAEIDAEYSRLTGAISSCREEISGLFRELDSLPAVHRFTLEDKRAFTIAIGRRVLNSELVPDGRIPVYSANVIEPFGYVDGLLRGVEDFGQDSVLWGIDGDFMVSFMEHGREFYPTDHCGVLRVITDKVHPRYMAHVLEREGQRMRFSRNFRASLDRVGGISFGVPEMAEQVRAMNEVRRLEGEIEECREKLKSLEGRKGEVLKKYL